VREGRDQKEEIRRREGMDKKKGPLNSFRCQRRRHSIIISANGEDGEDA
jgi:hypothetical protein